jgi:hypothetical protein
MKKLKLDKTFTPCPVVDGDELFPNGIFVFNITKMIEYVHSNTASLPIEEVSVADLPEKNASINWSHVDTTDVSLPIILAEIAPGRYNVIDGNHRVEKARKMGIPKVPAYRLTIPQHVRFLTDKKAYVSYIEYVNGKLKNMEEMERYEANRGIR